MHLPTRPIPNGRVTDPSLFALSAFEALEPQNYPLGSEDASAATRALNTVDVLEMMSEPTAARACSPRTGVSRASSERGCSGPSARHFEGENVTKFATDNKRREVDVADVIFVGSTLDLPTLSALRKVRWLARTTSPRKSVTQDGAAIDLKLARLLLNVMVHRSSPAMSLLPAIIGKPPVKLNPEHHHPSPQCYHPTDDHYTSR